ncbi:hypothetical protein HXX76_010890 [Chlamydomonas incerta]|uniref:Uncharacterized protein n=1 Tax=Chlamydomonas incerta TaxID=51695 RepID=A0A835SKE3_CHLIN|nr:hypothetical protein HXX76_010890 [Chlamydomonas incerta]|eukprot:KAG2427171.1 hypothetical protein HXX76_010890 [Chlamydomonas incerta]
MGVVSFQHPDKEHPAPFPLIPTGVHIATMLAAAFPFVEIVDDKVAVRTSPEIFADSLRYTMLGCTLLTAGYYACQFVRALGPLRHEYLGTAALLQMMYLAVVAGRAWFYPAAAAADLYGSVLGSAAAVLGIVLTWYDKYDPRICPEAVGMSDSEIFERLPTNSDAATKAAAKALSARLAARRNALRRLAAVLVPAATHTLWVLYAASLNLSYIAPYLASHIPSYQTYGAPVQSALSYCAEVPYRPYVLALVDGLTVLRLVAVVSGRRKAAEEEEPASAAEAKAAEPKSD